MYPHAYFALWLHDDDELAAVIGSPIMHRTTIHEWPLSCVQQLTTMAGERFFYKVQSPPSVEIAFYQQVQAPWLMDVRILPSTQPDTLPALLFADKNARPACATDFSLPQIDQLLCQTVATLSTASPHWCDIGTWEQWRRYSHETIGLLEAHITSHAFTRVQQADAELLAQMVDSAALHAWYTQTPIGFVHGDMHVNNLLMHDGSIVIIDWQRPLVAPRIIDTITLRHSLGIPMQDIPLVALQCWMFLQIDWLVRAGHDWVPTGCAMFDQQIDSMMQRLRADMP